MLSMQLLIRGIFGTLKRASVTVFCLCLTSLCLHTYGHTFYVDALSGNDASSGHSQHDAWKTLRQVNITTFAPGDSILFHAGQQWEGMIFPRGSGVEEHPIVISKYGGDILPKIHGGHADPVDFEGYRTIQTVLLYNQQHWVISNLEITNMPDNIICDFDDNGEERRRGIYIVASDTGELKNITIKDSYVHHVKGNDLKDFHGSGGIILAVLGKTKASFFNGVYILNNRVYMVNRTGISISSYWQRRRRNQDYPGSWMNKMGPYQANLNVVISGNELESIGGDGIVPQTSFKAFMENNRVKGAACRSDGYNAGLWAWNSDSVLIQYNEVWDTQSVRDGMAFDCDTYSTGNIYRYNFSHDNKGGFLLMFGHSPDVPGAKNIGHIIRHNISMNDGTALLHLYGSGHTRSSIHQNLFYNTSAQIIPVLVQGKPSDIKICHNIFYLPAMGKFTGIDSIGCFCFSGNIIKGIRRNIPGKRENIIRTPTLKDAYLLFGQYCRDDMSNMFLTPEDITQLWNLILQGRDRIIAKP